MEYLVDPSLLAADHARNISRGRLPPDPDAVAEMADMLLRHGQLAPVEVDTSVWPAGWGDTCDDEHERTTIEDMFARHPPPIVYGFRRHAAALLLKQQGRTSPRWVGLLRVTVAPAGMTAEDAEDRNLAENLGAQAVAYVDLGLAAHRLTSPPEFVGGVNVGGRGEDKSVVARKLRVPLAEVDRLVLLPRLCEEARALSRLNHRIPDAGITPQQALKLARRTVEEQHRILAEARDAERLVTPKAARAVIAPLSGRQGQPPGATGAQLSRLAARLGKIAESPEEQSRLKVTAEQAALCAALAGALVGLDAAALARLPGRLGKVVEDEVSRSGSRE